MLHGRTFHGWSAHGRTAHGWVTRNKTIRVWTVSSWSTYIKYLETRYPCQVYPWMDLFIDPRLGVLYKSVYAGLFADKLTIILGHKFKSPSMGGMLHGRGDENNMLFMLYTDGM